MHTLEDVQAILSEFRSHGHTEIDTARLYGGGSSEEFLGKLECEKQGLKLETKLWPTAVSISNKQPSEGDLTNVAGLCFHQGPRNRPNVSFPRGKKSLLAKQSRQVNKRFA